MLKSFSYLFPKIKIEGSLHKLGSEPSVIQDESPSIRTYKERLFSSWFLLQCGGAHRIFLLALGRL